MSGVCASPYVLRARLRGQAVLLDLRSRKCFGLNPTGETIWRGLERCDSSDTLVDGLCRRFAVSRPEAAASVTRFMAELTTRDLITLPPSRTHSPSSTDA